MTDDSPSPMDDSTWTDAVRDSLALAALYVEGGLRGQVDSASYQAILGNGDPAAIAAAGAVALAGCLLLLEEPKAIPSASSMLRELQQMYAAGGPRA